MPDKILVIEDNTESRALLEDLLSAAGYEPLSASNALEGLRLLYNSHPALVLLDIMLPGIDGWEACRRIREASEVPIIIVSGRSSNIDILRGFELGADDYVIRPFEHKELLSRVRAVLRRSKNGDGKEPSALKCDGLEADLRTHRVSVKGRMVALSPTEFRLLTYLMRKQNSVVSHRELLFNVWGPAYVNEKEYIKLYVSYLRKKLEEDPEKPKYIVNQRGVGYRLAQGP
ncbi:MAG TPA: response regulator transcription factor [Dehalococcoidia bacterium]|nr:response regulator transcription factor [Dehalococcoidia bacterium]